ncbi:2-keto-3-deoxy-phosphogluconate aldolase [Halanaerobium saccharolyticum]|uniref:2-keto-3-deoxy-phosphogluconate aldolase n=2 Tax=Halanaerobium saccharolyticum TaxID=43595 RepID=A0A4R7Z7E2_9FIRM|nr:bifunctional 2-keto-4-hydroxyglutarate aldolase/2-keto-3-deoxy-6-phosphogluconate aldolase [Halanaerobium saccharolyticum]RAK12481.1 2-keto-3-deoxy-phosphogluconate aldolase [Halanaerobium saccharolyticum]TDW06407.1 2-keto-3-deoxy-phosphogluconate aldolase [Halanaerobium saccharolyticum]TDX61655.1 2-keto-3-deoxy-phosphogluconate aldolase [Halanaerobium saccharolyticum]
MMNTINKLQETGIVAVIRAQNGDEAVKIARAVKKGGIKGLEITMTVPGAVDVISELSKEFEGEEIIIGAGSVLDAETARTCILAGAEYIVSPSFNEEMVKLANRYQKPVIPGAMTVTEVVKAMEAGADLVKIFPASLFGPKIIKAIKGPVPQAPLLPTGGVSLDNVAEWIKAGSAAVGVGSSLTAGAKTGDFDKVTQTAAAFVEKIAKAREV